MEGRGVGDKVIKLQDYLEEAQSINGDHSKIFCIIQFRGQFTLANKFSTPLPFSGPPFATILT